MDESPTSTNGATSGGGRCHWISEWFSSSQQACNRLRSRWSVVRMGPLTFGSDDESEVDSTGGMWRTKTDGVAVPSALVPSTVDYVAFGETTDATQWSTFDLRRLSLGYEAYWLSRVESAADAWQAANDAAAGKGTVQFASPGRDAPPGAVSGLGSTLRKRSLFTSPERATTAKTTPTTNNAMGDTMRSLRSPMSPATLGNQQAKPLQVVYLIAQPYGSRGAGTAKQSALASEPMASRRRHVMIRGREHAEMETQTAVQYKHYDAARRTDLLSVEQREVIERATLLECERVTLWGLLLDRALDAKLHGYEYGVGDGFDGQPFAGAMPDPLIQLLLDEARHRGILERSAKATANHFAALRVTLLTLVWETNDTRYAEATSAHTGNPPSVQ